MNQSFHAGFSNWTSQQTYKVFGHVATRVHVLVSEGCDFLLMFPPIMLLYTKSSWTTQNKILLMSAGLRNCLVVPMNIIILFSELDCIIGFETTAASGL